VLGLDRHGEAVDDRAHDLEQLADAVVRVVHLDAVDEEADDFAANQRAQRHDLAVDAVQRRFQVVALARVLRVEQRHELAHKWRR
jgi:hypothetical protein